jgi:hypothetical protein
MTPLKKLIFAAFLAALLGLAAGCTTKTDKDSSIPWNRPASWEGQIPGMGTGQ